MRGKKKCRLTGGVARGDRKVPGRGATTREDRIQTLNSYAPSRGKSQIEERLSLKTGVAPFGVSGVFWGKA